MKRSFNPSMILITLSVLLILIFLACEKDDIIEQTFESQIEKLQGAFLSFENSEPIRISNFTNNSSYANKKFDFGVQPVDESQFKTIMSQFDIGNLHIDLRECFALVLYSSFDESNSIKSDQVFAISYYHIRDSKPVQSLITFDQGSLPKIKISTPVSGVHSSSLRYLLFHQLGAQKFINRAIIVFYNHEINYDMLDWDFETLGIYAHEAKQKLRTIDLRRPTCDGCPIPDEPDNCHVIQQVCMYTFDDDSCRDHAHPDYLDSNNLMSKDSAFHAHDTTMHYELRDSLLINYTTGQDFINKYYRLHQIIEEEGIEEISNSLIIETALVLYKLHDGLEKLIDHQNNGSHVLINTSLAGDIDDILDDYRDLTDNSEWEDSIDEIKDEVDNYKNKTISYIINNL